MFCRRSIPALLLILALILFVPALHFAAEGLSLMPEAEFSGFLESRHSIQAQSPNDTLSSETLARLEFTGFWDAATLFASADLSENHLMGEDSGISLHEVYLDTSLGRVDMRVGRQIIIWGAADGVRITDNISPVDYSEYITRSFDELRMGVDALNLKYNTDKGMLQLIWIPVYRAGISPSCDSPWYLGGSSSQVLGDEQKPATGIKDSEMAAKYALFLPGADLAFSYFYTWNDFPAYQPVSLEDGSTAFSPFYYRIHIAGADLSIPWRDFVLRAEGAWFHGPRFSTLLGTDPVKKDQVKWLAGLDWYPGNNWTFSFQYSRERILSPVTEMAVRSRMDLLTLNISKKLFREKFVVSAMVYLDPDLGDSLARLTSEFEVMDGCALTLGTDIFSGDEQGRFGQYQNNTQVWTKLKYHF